MGGGMASRGLKHPAEKCRVKIERQRDTRWYLV